MLIVLVIDMVQARCRRVIAFDYAVQALSRSISRKSGLIEIDLGSGKRVRVDTYVDADALSRVLYELPYTSIQRGWLDIPESGVGVWALQCLSRLYFSDKQKLAKEIEAWKPYRRRKSAIRKGQYHIKLKYLHPQLTNVEY